MWVYFILITNDVCIYRAIPNDRWLYDYIWLDIKVKKNKKKTSRLAGKIWPIHWTVSMYINKYGNFCRHISIRSWKSIVGITSNKYYVSLYLILQKLLFIIVCMFVCVCVCVSFKNPNRIVYTALLLFVYSIPFFFYNHIC